MYFVSFSIELPILLLTSAIILLHNWCTCWMYFFYKQRNRNLRCKNSKWFKKCYINIYNFFSLGGFTWIVLFVLIGFHSVRFSRHVVWNAVLNICVFRVYVSEWLVLVVMVAIPPPHTQKMMLEKVFLILLFRWWAWICCVLSSIYCAPTCFWFFLFLFLFLFSSFGRSGSSNWSVWVWMGSQDWFKGTWSCEWSCLNMYHLHLATSYPFLCDFHPPPVG